METNRSQPQSSVPQSSHRLWILELRPLSTREKGEPRRYSPLTEHHFKGKIFLIITPVRKHSLRMSSVEIFLFLGGKPKAKANKRTCLGFVVVYKTGSSVQPWLAFGLKRHISPCILRAEIKDVHHTTWALHTISSTPSSQWLSQCCVTLSKEKCLIILLKFLYC